MSKRVACTPHGLAIARRHQYCTRRMRCKLCGVRTAHYSVEFGGPKQICSGCAVSRVGRVGPRVVPRRAGAAGRRVNREASACGAGGCDACRLAPAKRQCAEVQGQRLTCCHCCSSISLGCLGDLITAAKARFITDDDGVHLQQRRYRGDFRVTISYSFIGQ